MSPTTSRGRLAAALVAATTAVSLPLSLGIGADAAPKPAKPAASKPAKPAKPAKPGSHAPGQQPIELDLLALNDFHGQLEKVPATSSSGRVATNDQGDVAAGGAAYLATHLDRLRDAAAARGAQTLTVAAGDLIGATPLISAAFHDEPTIEAMNLMGLDITSVGNHEFDEGYRELLRMQDGGCLEDGPDGKDNQNSCPDESRPFTGADFQYLSANVRYAGTDDTVFPAYVVKKVGRAKVGFVGLTLEDTPNIVTKAGVEGLEFVDEVEAVRDVLPELRAQGVRSIVVLMHQGGAPSDTKDYNGCSQGRTGVTGPGIDIARELPAAVDVVIEGHTHQAYNCVVTDPAGQPRRVTSASSVGRLVTDIRLQIDPRSKDVIRPKVTAQNVIVRNADGTAEDPAIVDLIGRYNTLVAPIANKVLGHLAPVGTANQSLPKSPTDRDFDLGNLIADSQLADTSHQGGRPAATIALMNPGGIRTSLNENAAGEVTYGAAFAVQPFNNYLVSENLTGAQVVEALEDQWNDRNEGAANNKVLQVSGLRYTYSASRAAEVGANAIVGDVLVDDDGDGQVDDPIVASKTYRVVVNSFLSDGGDGFPTLNGADKYFGGLDIDALASYLAAHDPYDPASVPQGRITVAP